ncbi:VIT1/CCC1 transporter family protein [Devosia sp. CN2-171]|uniref:VIT1/CCC1 transporter family protein n=1 Tax=Devosia sp. CN2-171 TaxID=3400909 RepID=UPI003BF8CF6E
MTRMKTHTEDHQVGRIGWLRAAVLGANDGIVSTASLIIGVAAASGDKGALVVAGVAGLVAGAMSMAAGEYVSVSSQSDTEAASLAKETWELANAPASEHAELTAIYVARGLEESLAGQVATQLMAKDALGAHARDELGLSEISAARPVQAALTSAVTFAIGAALPLLAVLVSPSEWMIWIVALASLAFLGALGATGAAAGGASPWKPTVRVVFWGALAMLITAAIGALFGTVV